MIRPLPINANPAAVCGRSITEPDITSEIPTIAMAAPAITNANTPTMIVNTIASPVARIPPIIGIKTGPIIIARATIKTIFPIRAFFFF